MGVCVEDDMTQSRGAQIVPSENDEPDSPTVAGVDIARSASLDSEAAMTCLDAADYDGCDSPTASGVDIARNAMGAGGSEESKTCARS